MFKYPLFQSRRFLSTRQPLLIPNPGPGSQGSSFCLCLIWTFHRIGIVEHMAFLGLWALPCFVFSRFTLAAVSEFYSFSWLNSIRLHRYATICLSIHQLMVACLIFFDLYTLPLQTLTSKPFCGYQCVCGVCMLCKYEYMCIGTCMLDV